MGKQYTFVLNFGYVESSCLYYFPFTSEQKYKDAKEALVDLAKFLKEMYEINHKVELKDCCKKNQAKDPEAEFCSKCRRPLKEDDFNPEHFGDWLREMSSCDIDSFHGDYIEYDDTQRWQNNGLEGAPNQRFVYQAEWVLTAALGYPHREDNTWDDICKARTKDKCVSFSYY